MRRHLASASTSRIPLTSTIFFNSLQTPRLFKCIWNIRRWTHMVERAMHIGLRPNSEIFNVSECARFNFREARKKVREKHMQFLVLRTTSNVRRFNDRCSWPPGGSQLRSD